MAEKSILWTAPGTGDGTSGYTQAETTRLFRGLTGENNVQSGNRAVLFGIDNALVPAGTSSPVTIGTGAAICQGFF
jgi:hypothetical protein